MSLLFVTYCRGLSQNKEINITCRDSSNNMAIKVTTLFDQQSFYRRRYTTRVTLSKEDLHRLIWLFQQYCQEQVILIDGIPVRDPQDLDRFHYPLASSFHATGYLFDSTHPATSREAGAYVEFRVTQTQAEIIVPSTLKKEAKQAQTSAPIDSRS